MIGGGVLMVNQRHLGSISGVSIHYVDILYSFLILDTAMADKNGGYKFNEN